jgi:putative DNA primase/helicase
VEDHQDEIASARPEMPSALNDRAADIWEPLLVVADIVGGAWPKLAREAAMKLSAGVQESSVIGSLLLDVLFVFLQMKVDRVFSRVLADCLNHKTDRPWQEGRKGRPLDEVWLAQQLRPYGVRPKTIWIGEQAARGYLQSDFEEVWPRYVSRSDLDAVLAEVREREGVRNAECGTRSSEQESAQPRMHTNKHE